MVVESPQGEIMDTMTIEVEQNMDIAMEIETEIDIPEIEVEELPEISLEIEEMSNVEESNLEGETQLFKTNPLVMRARNEVDTVTEHNKLTDKMEQLVQSAKQKVANKIVKNMGDKGRYDETNQLKTLVVMQVLETKDFL